MNTLNLDVNKRYTYADYLTWMDDVRRELYDGFIQLMTPAPSRKHQRVSSNLHGVFWNFLRYQKCEIYSAPSDVRFPGNKTSKNDKQINTVLQPDLYIVCDPEKLDDRGCLGAPDLVVEIVSPSSSRKDLKDKYEIYQKHGVREYWIVNPNDENVNVFLRNESGKFELKGLFPGDDQIPVTIFNGELIIDLKEIFVS